MTTTLELTPPPNRSRADQIWDIFQEIGPCSTRRLADECLQRKVWTDDEQHTILFRGCQAEIRLALKKADAAGLSRSGMTTQTDETNEPVWAARQQWLFADYELNCQEVWDGADELNRIGEAYAAECQERYGKRPRRKRH